MGGLTMLSLIVMLGLLALLPLGWWLILYRADDSQPFKRQTRMPTPAEAESMRELARLSAPKPLRRFAESSVDEAPDDKADDWVGEVWYDLDDPPAPDRSSARPVRLRVRRSPPEQRATPAETIRVVFEQDGDTWHVTSPDVPGIFAGYDTREEAEADAVSLLSFALERDVTRDELDFRYEPQPYVTRASGVVLESTMTTRPGTWVP